MQVFEVHEWDITLALNYLSHLLHQFRKIIFDDN